MDSFFSLFDPADSTSNKPKKERRKAPPKTEQSQDTARRKEQSCDGNRKSSEPDETRRTVDTSVKAKWKSDWRNNNQSGDSAKRKNSQGDVKASQSTDTAKRKEQTETKKKKQSKVSSPRKNAHLPEESSFLCDPDISTDMLVKDTSYIDSYIEFEKKDCQVKSPKDATTEERNVKRRNSGRKNRRKKSKVTPPKDFIPKRCWNEENLFYPEYANAYDSKEEKINNWNNKLNYKNNKNPDNLGKHVNNLQDNNLEKEIENDADYSKKAKRKSEPFNIDRQADGDLSEWLQSSSCDKAYNAIEKLEKVSLQDDLYLTGDLEDLENDVFYSSDEEDTGDEDWSNLDEESGDEVYGSLPPEPQLGNVEYKLKLANVSDKRFQHLVTQLKWRLRSGGGSAVYVVGVRDCGALRGLRAKALRSSLYTLRRMAATLRATVRHVTARRVAPHRAVAEVYIRKLADTQQSVELRVAVMGANEAGKSTLIGVLTQGELDNGRGSARLNMFRHVHEVRSGRTSSLSHEILGFDARGCVVNYGCSELMTAERIEERSSKLVSFLDLAGHSKYQRTTVHGLTGYSPHYAMLVVSATAGINRMTEEHLGLLLALDMAFFVVVTKLELAPGNMSQLLTRIQQILDEGECRKRPLLITDEHLARTCASAETPILDKLSAGSLPTQDEVIADKVKEMVPVFPVSCVTGAGLNSLHGYLLGLEPPAPPPSDERPDPEEEACEFQIDEIFRVGESCGPVVGGLMAKGQLAEGEELLIGPLDTGDFVPITVKTIYRNRVPCGSVRAGQSASLGLSHHLPNLRQGMVLVAIPEGYDLKNYNNGLNIGNLTNIADDSKIKIEHSNIKDDNYNIKDDNNCNIEYDSNHRDDNTNHNNDDSNLKTENTKNRYDNPNIKNENTKHKDDNSNPKIVKLNNNCKTSELDRRKGDTKKIYKVKGDRWDVKNFKRKEKNILKELANVENSLAKETLDLKENLYKSDSDSDENGSKLDSNNLALNQIGTKIDVKSLELDENTSLTVPIGLKLDESGSKLVSSDSESTCSCCEMLLEDPNDPRGCLFFQATVRVLRHSTAIYPGFQATVHIGNIRQTAVIEGIMSSNSVLRSGESASVLFRFVRQPEYVRSGRKMLFRDGLETRGVGRLTQVFPYAGAH